MKIAINGEIIETENIYKITKIITYSYPKSPVMKCDRRINNDNPTEGEFFIKFFTNKTIKINNKDIVSLNYFRDQIIEIWSNNQSKIPQFNI